MDASNQLEAMILAATGATAVTRREIVQSLWSGYGQIVRCTLEGARATSVIVKHVRWPDHSDHPRGWNSDRSHKRKVESYAVETRWYEDYAARCGDDCRTPQCLSAHKHGDEVVLVLEDLDAAGFGRRCTRVGPPEVDACLRWLAHFHATFMTSTAEGLWPVGTYWHLATRPDELAALDDGPLKSHAEAIDRRLSDGRFQTLVHGDAKLANFCFSPNGRQVAAVDFQYVGGGCGMKDVAYFISSCFDEDQIERDHDALLDQYFHHLGQAVKQQRLELDFAALQAEWRAMAPIAWTDFVRFLKGWSPGHWKLHRYSERIAREVLSAL